MDNEENIFFFDIKFMLRPIKQRFLLNMLLEHSVLDLVELARLMEINFESLWQLFRQQCYLSEDDARQLVEYFCVLCGA